MRDCCRRRSWRVSPQLSRETPPAFEPVPGVQSSQGPAIAEPVDRVATVEDLDRMESLTLKDFAVDFSKIEIPETLPGQRLTEGQLDVAVESFLASLRPEDRTR